jgi:hypothetical protein
MFSVLCSSLLAAAVGSTTDEFTTQAGIQGVYLEARTCDVYTGPCFANSEVNEDGREATLAWKVTAGNWQGVDLEGLSAVAVVHSTATLGDPYAENAKQRSILFLDERANHRQAEALRSFALHQLGDLAGEVVAERRVEIDLKSGGCKEAGCGELRAGGLVRMQTRCLCDDDHVCGNEALFYPPLTAVIDPIPAFTVKHAMKDRALGVRFSDHDSRSSFTGRFRVEHGE